MGARANKYKQQDKHKCCDTVFLTRWIRMLLDSNSQEFCRVDEKMK